MQGWKVAVKMVFVLWKQKKFKINKKEFSLSISEILLYNKFVVGGHFFLDFLL